MPWCEPCERFWNPGTLTLDGKCPRCGAVLEAPSTPVEPVRSSAPWHFWLFLAAAVVYLAWRAIEGIALLF
ncbi:MAG: hypothetical protein OXE93_05665 [bacterium]|nr:hypothetical protein [bacterium]MCY4257062.1 hypothetical protein [bacterium]